MRRVTPARAEDEVAVVEQRVIEQHRRNARDERDDPQHAGDPPSLRGGIPLSRADIDDRSGEATDMPTPLDRGVRTASGATGDTVNAQTREPLDHPAYFRGEAQADHTHAEEARGIFDADDAPAATPLSVFELLSDATDGEPVLRAADANDPHAGTQQNASLRHRLDRINVGWIGATAPEPHELTAHRRGQLVLIDAVSRRPRGPRRDGASTSAPRPWRVRLPCGPRARPCAAPPAPPRSPARPRRPAAA